MKYSYDNLEMTVTYRKDKEIEIRVANHNTFRVGNITVTTEYAGKKRTEFIGRIEAHETWKSGDRTENIPPFHAASFYEGKEQIIDPGLYDEKSGVYRGEPFHALVWRDEEKRKTWQRSHTWVSEDPAAEVTLSYFADGPRVAFTGNSFTGLWDSTYEYFRQMAEADGYHAQVAYSYWEGTGLAQYAGLIPESMERAEQCQKVLDANEEYDFCFFAGNSDEALSTHSGKPGAEDYSLRENMEKAVRILKKRAEEKHAKMVLWAPHAYQYGFFRDKTAKPWKIGNVGDWYERDGWRYQLTLSEQEMVERNMEWYRHLCEEPENKGILLAPVVRAYHEVVKCGIGDPYLAEEKTGDFGHQNNLGNYISACVCFEIVFGEMPKADFVPVSHTWGMGGGTLTPHQAAMIRKKVHEVMEEERTR